MVVFYIKKRYKLQLKKTSCDQTMVNEKKDASLTPPYHSLPIPFIIMVWDQFSTSFEDYYLLTLDIKISSIFLIKIFLAAFLFS